MKKLVLFSLLAGFSALGLSAQSKCANDKIQMIEPKAPLNLPSLKPFQGFMYSFRSSNLCSYAYTIRRVELNAHQIKVQVRHTLFVDADHGKITIKGCRTEDIAYFIDGVRIRSGKVNLTL
jgi:hypothetical protein